MIKTYHFTKEYVLWGDSWINLRLYVADTAFYDYEAESEYSYETDDIDDDDDIKDFLKL